MLRMPIPVLPIPALLTFTVIVIVGALEVGYRFGRYQRARPRHDLDTAASDLSTPTIALLGLMLAFTFGWSATRFDSRRSARLQEAQATERLYRLAGFLPPAERAQVRSILLEYINVSMNVKDVESFEATFQRREQLHRQLWQIAEAAGRADPHSDIAGQIVAATNGVLDAHISRSVLASSNRIPQAIQNGLLTIIVLATLMIGYHLGLTGSPRSPLMVPFVIAVTIVVFLIVDLDRPFEGSLRVRDDALEQAQRELRDWQ